MAWIDKTLKNYLFKRCSAVGLNLGSSQVGLPLSAVTNRLFRAIQTRDFYPFARRSMTTTSTLAEFTPSSNVNVNPNVEASAFAIFNQHLETSIMAKVMEHLMTNTVLMNQPKTELFLGNVRV